MPELPDLAVFSKNLTKMIQRKVLKSAVIHQKQKIKVSEKDLQALEGKRLDKVYREGKRLFFDFGKDALLALHLMLHGKLVYSDDPKPKYTLLSLTFQDGKTLSVTDFQQLANVELNPPQADAVDALSTKLSPQFLEDLLQSSRSKIKTLLMDQKHIAGIGNAYADEILYEANISPLSVANKIPEKEIKKLAKAIKEVLEQAEKHILKTHPDIISGEVRDFMKVHNSKAVTDAKGNKILQTKIGGRSTYYTEQQHTFS
ncbi:MULTISPECIES: DNA-formamidopyrimidine glycosylase family protein [unclassified Sphingobacterium]|uniref:DNA-formamidopyrimidine glycosylase family protein n=1 Tax=unclassified Sphingobacterium TaxID=2609468 RepID=UPI0025D8E70D|nr:MULTISPECIES: DNA-formamidopyrimidine glycosylase family protein [unclassified Sphingobacterium]